MFVLLLFTIIRITPNYISRLSSKYILKDPQIEGENLVSVGYGVLSFSNKNWYDLYTSFFPDCKRKTLLTLTTMFFLENTFYGEKY